MMEIIVYSYVGGFILFVGILIGLLASARIAWTTLKEVGRLRAALAFYANPYNYDHDTIGYYDGTTPVLRDGGKLAQEALKEQR